MKSNSVIIVAGGKGLRMGSDLPKQFIPVGGVPVLMRTIEAFYDYDSSIHIILAINPDYEEYWTALCNQHNFEIKHTIVHGGETRFHSVKNALAFVNTDLVGVHDAVRPFTSKSLLARCFDSSQENLAVVPVVDSVDSLRQIAGNRSWIVDRRDFKLVQTPQVFDTVILKKSYDVDYSVLFTDDASVVEASGYFVTLVEGDRDNIKITTPLDLKYAELLI